ncbi:hypothetical protein G9F72_017660 [Clostridium estertheticum]|uniref:hypothetical protein n=1 Tax=Clostridium estertheticum TaxID=238834 RepID=UPI0013E93411|nr:hypothetical protein [Clostridium estertheticum]MBZ9688163.1 hypothetical protein [Clostridium estertheticum]
MLNKLFERLKFKSTTKKSNSENSASSKLYYCLTNIHAVIIIAIASTFRKES